MKRLANLTGLSQAMISILESSQPNPKLDTLLRLARSLELDLGSLIQQAMANVAKSTAANEEPAKSHKTSGRSSSREPVIPPPRPQYFPLSADGSAWSPCQIFPGRHLIPTFLAAEGSSLSNVAGGKSRRMASSK